VAGAGMEPVDGAGMEPRLTAEQSYSRRNQILSAALDVIAERGCPDTRVADVALLAAVRVGLCI